MHDDPQVMLSPVISWSSQCLCTSCVTVGHVMLRHILHLLVVFIYWRLIAQSTAQTHLGAWLYWITMDCCWLFTSHTCFVLPAMCELPGVWRAMTTRRPTGSKQSTSYSSFGPAGCWTSHASARWGTQSASTSASSSTSQSTPLFINHLLCDTVSSLMFALIV